MDDRFAGLAATVVGLALVAVTVAEYVAPGFPPPPAEPFATGALVALGGLSLLAAGALAIRAALDHLALRIATGVGLLALALAVIAPTTLLFGGVFWFGLLLAALMAAGATRTLVHWL